MKKIWFVCLFAFLVSCIGCSFVEDIIGEDDDDDGNKYVWEYGYIDSSQKEPIFLYSFEQKKSVRDSLRRKSYKYHSPSNISESWFRNYLQDTTTMTPAEIETFIRNLNEVGNAILYLYYTSNPSETIWYYLEKR